MSVTTTVIRTTATQGAPGLSAYQIAVRNGFIGTEAEWETSLQAVVRETLVISNPTSSWSNVIGEISWPSGSYVVTLISTAPGGESVYTGYLSWSQQVYPDSRPADIIVLYNSGNNDVVLELQFDYSGVENASLQIRSGGVEDPTSVNVKITQIG